MPIHSGPSILRPPMGRRKCGFILQNKDHLTQNIALWDQSSGLIIKGGFKIVGCKIEGLLKEWLWYAM